MTLLLLLAANIRIFVYFVLDKAFLFLYRLRPYPIIFCFFFNLGFSKNNIKNLLFRSKLYTFASYFRRKKIIDRL